MGRYKKKTHSLVQRAVRYAEEEGEEYAIVTQVFGGSRCEVKLPSGENCTCIIRNKFRGRGRRENFIKVGGWVLVGEREWERARAGKLNTVDLLYVYSPNEKETLTARVPIVAKALKRMDPNFDGQPENLQDVDEEVFFVQDEEEKLSEDEGESVDRVLEGGLNINTDLRIDIDDI